MLLVRRDNMLFKGTSGAQLKLSEHLNRLIYQYMDIFGGINILVNRL